MSITIGHTEPGRGFQLFLPVWVRMEADIVRFPGVRRICKNNIRQVFRKFEQDMEALPTSDYAF